MSTEENPQQVSRGLLIVLGVVVGLAGLYALYTFVISPLLADDGTDDPGVVTTDPDDQADPDDVASPGDTDGPGDAPDDPDAPAPDDGTQDGVDDLAEADVVPETFEIFTARDPFQQLVVEAPVADTPTAPGPTTPTTPTSPTTPTTPTTPGGGTGGGGTGGGGTGGGGTGGGGTGGGGTGGGGTGGGGMNGDSVGDRGEDAPSSANVGSTTIGLSDVFVGEDGEPRVLVTVNGTTYEVGEGDVFADRFQVLDIDGVCATFLFGDSRFTLCEGESIIK